MEIVEQNKRDKQIEVEREKEREEAQKLQPMSDEECEELRKIFEEDLEQERISKKSKNKKAKTKVNAFCVKGKILEANRRILELASGLQQELMGANSDKDFLLRAHQKTVIDSSFNDYTKTSNIFLMI